MAVKVRENLTLDPSIVLPNDSWNRAKRLHSAVELHDKVRVFQVAPTTKQLTHSCRGDGRIVVKIGRGTTTPGPFFNLFLEEK